MKQQTSNRTHKTYLLLALMVLVLVVANRVAAGTKSTVAPIEKSGTSCTVIKTGIIERVVSEIEDLPWRPLVSFFK